MTSTTTFAPASLPQSAPAAARAVFRLLQGLRHGSLDVQMPDGSSAHFGNKSEDGPRAAIRLRNWNVCSAALRSGDIGFAEAYIGGHWTSPDLVALLQTSVSGHLAPLDVRSVRAAFFGMPLMTLGVIVRIHWHALQLWRKRTPFFRKPAPPQAFTTR